MVSITITGIVITDVDYDVLRYLLAKYLTDTGLSAPSLFEEGSRPADCEFGDPCAEATFIKAELKCLPKPNFAEKIALPLL